jgi:ABC-type amino acid transport substrate-binding protein
VVEKLLLNHGLDEICAEIESTWPRRELSRFNSSPFARFGPNERAERS